MTRLEKLYHRMHKLKYRLKKSVDRSNEYHYIPKCTTPGITTLIGINYYYTPTIEQVRTRCLKLVNKKEAKLTITYVPSRKMYTYCMSINNGACWNVLEKASSTDELAAVCELWIKLKEIL